MSRDNMNFYHTHLMTSCEDDILPFGSLNILCLQVFRAGDVGWGGGGVESVCSEVITIPPDLAARRGGGATLQTFKVEYLS
jgi:hypothetical protein